MEAPFFHEFKKQASFFFKEKIRTARLALTDVTPSELLTEEATNGNPWAPDARTLKIISRAAFEVDDYWRIVEILHKRLVRFDRKNWRPSYKALILLEHLLTHGPESVAEEFQTDKDVIREMESFQHIDEKGFNWGLSVRKKSEMILKLLEKGPVLKAERDRARKLTRGIEGFGSFCQRTTYGQGKVLQEFSPNGYGRSNSQFNDQGNQESQFSNSNDQNSLETSSGLLQQGNEEKSNLLTNKEMENLNYLHGFNAHMNLDSNHSQTSFKENMAPNKGMHSDLDNFHNWTYTRESKSLLNDEEGHSGGDGFVVGGSSVYVEGDHHPFNGTEHLTAVSLLSKSEKMLETC